MGYYINPPDGRTRQKGEWLVDTYGAKEVSVDHAYDIVTIGGDKGIVCVVDNGMFEAAAYCYDRNEYMVFADWRDMRPKRWYCMDREIIEKLSNY